MASKTVVTLVDDLDGSTDGVKTVELGFDGATYELDLSEANQAALSEALARYLEAARRTGGRRKRSTGTQTTPVSSDNQTIRAWADANGIEVPARGRISAKVREQFEAAND